VGSERTLLQDAAFGMRQLVDIAFKALSPAVNDPYTAVMSVEKLTALLAARAPRRLVTLFLYDPDGPSRVVAHFPTFADYVNLAIGQIRRYGVGEAAGRLCTTAAASGSRHGDRQQQTAAGPGQSRTARASRCRTTICQPADLAVSRARARPFSRRWRAKGPSDLLELAHEEASLPK
jgi:Predicted membrane protein (DUF2254)